MRLPCLLVLFGFACASPPRMTPAPLVSDLAAAVVRYWRTRPSGISMVPFPTEKDTLVPMSWTSFQSASDESADSLLAAGVRPVTLWAILEDDESILGDSILTDALRLPRSLAASFREANRTSQRLQEPPRVAGISISLLDTGSSSFDRPILYLSRPGLNAAGDSALIHVSEVCGRLCGEGTLVLLIRTRQGWRVVESFGAEFS